MEFYFISFFFISIVDTITAISVFSPLALFNQSLPPIPPGHHRTVVCVYGLCIHVLRLIPSLPFQQKHLVEKK